MSDSDSESKLIEFLVKPTDLSTMRVLKAHQASVKPHGTEFVNYDGQDRVVFFAPNHRTDYWTEAGASEVALQPNRKR